MALRTCGRRFTSGLGVLGVRGRPRWAGALSYRFGRAAEGSEGAAAAPRACAATTVRLQLQPKRAGARSNRPVLSLRDSEQTLRQRDSVYRTRGSCAVLPFCRGGLECPLACKTLYRVGLKVPFSHGWSAACCGTARRPGAVLSRECRSLAAPSGARARTVLSNHHHDRRKAALPLQEPSSDLLRPCARNRRSLHRKQESGSRRARANSNPQNGPQTPLSNL